MRQIHEAVNRLASDKAPGPDEISNRVIKNTLPIIEDHLLVLMQASLKLSYFPKLFKQTVTAVLRKPGKPDYTKAKAYRPIALENTLGKVMESIMADVLSYLTEKYELLPPHHYGGRPGRSAEDAMIALSESIYKAWREKKIYTAIYMDVAGAFNNVHHKRLIHNLRKRRVPHTISKWIASFLENRSTQIQFNNEKSDQVNTPAGVPQGSPLSPLLYMNYNADLLDIASDHSVTGLGFIDDVVYGVQGDTDKGNIRKLKHILDQAEDWRKKHGAQFEESKYILVHYTRNKTMETKASIRVNNITIEPTAEAKYLGVIFDKELRFKSHLQYIIKKGTRTAMALTSVARCNWGPQYKYVRQLFQTVVAPRLDYAAIIWHRPRHNGDYANVAQMRGMTTVQRIAMKAILGCYRTTPTAAMEIEAGLPPTWIRLQTKVLLAITRMQSLSKNHPVHEWLARSLRTRTACMTHRSNLENILQQFPHMCTTIETIETHIRPPWWKPTAKVKVEDTKEDAKHLHNDIEKHQSNQAITIYTDGSGIVGKVGAATFKPSTDEVVHQYLGSETQFNVYVGELTAIQLAVEQLWSHPNCQVGRIYTDSQAAVKAIDRPQRQSGQAIIKDVLESIDHISSKHKELQIEIVWIPGHTQIEGNERADVEAKRAARDPTLSCPHKYKPLKSARVRQIKAAAKDQWNTQWNNNTKTATRLRRLMRRKDVKAGPALYNEIANRKGASTIIQMRTGHCGLNKYLHRFGKSITPYCQCGYGKETVEHYLLECKVYKEQRKCLKNKVGRGKMRVDLLLGDPKVVKHTLSHIEETGRFET